MLFWLANLGVFGDTAQLVWQEVWWGRAAIEMSTDAIEDMGWTAYIPSWSLQ